MVGIPWSTHAQNELFLTANISILNTDSRLGDGSELIISDDVTRSETDGHRSDNPQSYDEEVDDEVVELGKFQSAQSSTQKRRRKNNNSNKRNEPRTTNIHKTNNQNEIDYTNTEYADTVKAGKQQLQPLAQAEANIKEDFPGAQGLLPAAKKIVIGVISGSLDTMVGRVVVGLVGDLKKHNSLRKNTIDITTVAMCFPTPRDILTDAAAKVFDFHINLSPHNRSEAIARILESEVGIICMSSRSVCIIAWVLCG
jgi:hypothetical protein